MSFRNPCPLGSILLAAAIASVGAGCGGGGRSSEPGRAPIDFAPAVSYPTGGGGPGPAPEGTVAFDVESDGDTDVVVVDQNSDELALRLLKNHGDGTFEPGVPLVANQRVSAVDSADLNGDGHVDLVGANGLLVIVLLNDGHGEFSTSQTMAARTAAQVHAIAFDANADDKPDIVSITDGGVRAFLGHGDGTFAEGVLTPLAREPSALTRADVDGDGAVDLGLIDVGGHEAVALQGHNDGRFAERGSAFVGLVPEAIVAADFDEDGIEDFATADSFSFTMSVLLGDGAGGFRRVTHYPTGQGPASLATGDFNGDGSIDIAVSAVIDSDLTVFAGDGSGAFVEAGRFVLTGGPQTPVVADFDRDGRPDVAVGGSELSVLLNRTER